MTKQTDLLAVVDTGRQRENSAEDGSFDMRLHRPTVYMVQYGSWAPRRQNRNGSMFFCLGAGLEVYA